MTKNNIYRPLKFLTRQTAWDLKIRFESPSIHAPSIQCPLSFTYCHISSYWLSNQRHFHQTINGSSPWETLWTFLIHGGWGQTKQTEVTTSFIYWDGDVNPWDSTHYFNGIRSDTQWTSCLSTLLPMCNNWDPPPTPPLPHLPSTLPPAAKLSRSDYNFLALAVLLHGGWALRSPPIKAVIHL